MSPIILSILLGFTAAGAQATGDSTGPGNPVQAPIKGDLGQGNIFLSNEVGISMAVPEGAIIASRQGGEQPFFVVRDGGDQPRWSLRLESIPSDDPTAEAMIRRLMVRETGTEPSLTTLHDRPFPVADVTGHLAWVHESLANKKEVIFGWMVLPQGRIAGQLHYLVASAITVPEAFETAQPALEQALGTIVLRGPVLATLRARLEAEATEQFLKTLGEDQLRALDGHQATRRVYRPGEQGEADQEVAYTIFQVEAAPMGAVQARRPSDSYTPDEQEEGLLVRIHSRVVGDGDRDVYLDMLGLYWVAWDLSHEAWTATVTRRQKTITRTEKEFGFRTRQSLGEPQPRLVVIKQDDEINMREPYEWEVPEPWMPRALTWVLGLILPRDQPTQMSYAFFDHRHSTPQLGTRRDEWSPQSPGSSTWILQTWLDDSGLPARAEYGPDGLIRQRNPDGLFVETASPDDITRAWEQSGLRTR